MSTMEWRQSSFWLFFAASPSSIAATSTVAPDEGAVEEADGPLPDAEVGAAEVGDVVGGVEGEEPPAVGGVGVVVDTGVGLGWVP